MLASDTPEGALVRYYREGWRVGYLEEIKGQQVKIRPMAAYKAGKKKCVWVPLEGVERVEDKQ